MKRWDKWGQIVRAKAHDTCLGVGVMVQYAIILHFCMAGFGHTYMYNYGKFSTG
jgi:hypothetical protein